MAEQNEAGEWIKTTVKFVIAGESLDYPYDPMFGVGLDFDLEINPAERKIIGVQGLFDGETPTGLDWIMLDPRCIEEESQKEKEAE